MAKQSKIEQHGCQEIVAAGQRAGKSVREIAAECSDWAIEKISYTALQRYIESLQAKKKEIIVKEEHRVAAVVQQDFDIIQTN